MSWLGSVTGGSYETGTSAIPHARLGAGVVAPTVLDISRSQHNFVNEYFRNISRLYCFNNTKYILEGLRKLPFQLTLHRSFRREFDRLQRPRDL